MWNRTPMPADLRHPDDQKAYKAGYSDAYYGCPMWAGNDRNWHPDAYRDGYKNGTADTPYMTTSKREANMTLDHKRQ